MFDKLLGKKQKGMNIFNIPDKKYCHDSKKINKMDKKDLQQVISDMQKHISHLVQKLENGRKQCEKFIQKNQELTEKLNIVNAQVSKMSNQHQQLNIKFTNLQESLQFFSKEKEEILVTEVTFLEKHNLNRQKIRDIAKVLEIYKDQVNLCQKISLQNKNLKQKYNELEDQYYLLSQKLSEKKINGETEGTEENKSDQRQLKIDEEEKTKLKTIIEGKQQMIYSLNKQIRSQKLTNEELKENFVQLENENILIRNKISTKEEDLEEYKIKCKELEDKVRIIEKNEENINKKTEKLQREIQALIQVQKSLEKQKTELETNYEELGRDKMIMEQANRQHLQSVQESLNGVLTDCQRYREEVEQKKMEIENIQQKAKSYEEEMNNLLKMNSEISSKSAEIQKVKKKVQEKEAKIQELNLKIVKNEEDYQIKYRKYESELNQERIKMDGMRRTVNNLETKCEENKNLLDEMYEKKLIQDGKTVHMQKKLKQYKHLIQYLKKEKIQLEKTFQSKIKGFEEMVARESDGSDEENGKTEQPIEPEVKEESYEFQAELAILNSKMADMEEQMISYKKENEELKERNDELEEKNIRMQKNIKVLQEKREQIMKEIKKLEERPAKKEEKKVKDEGNRQKEKKIAQKAFRGFDIIYKHHHQLYKDFLQAMANQLEKQEVKQLETSLNNIIKKATDMRDIFTDYL